MDVSQALPLYIKFFGSGVLSPASAPSDLPVLAALVVQPHQT